METFRSQSLICGCCGQSFKTREGYEDQDQDSGYGICERCQKEDEKRNKKYYEDMFNELYSKAKQETKDKIDEKIKEMGDVYKTIIVNVGLERGWFKWGIQKSN